MTEPDHGRIGTYDGPVIVPSCNVSNFVMYSYRQALNNEGRNNDILLSLHTIFLDGTRVSMCTFDEDPFRPFSLLMENQASTD